MAVEHDFRAAVAGSRCRSQHATSARCSPAGSPFPRSRSPRPSGTGQPGPRVSLAPPRRSESRPATPCKTTQRERPTGSLASCPLLLFPNAPRERYAARPSSGAGHSCAGRTRNNNPLQGKAFSKPGSNRTESRRAQTRRPPNRGLRLQRAAAPRAPVAPPRGSRSWRILAGRFPGPRAGRVCGARPGFDRPLSRTARAAAGQRNHPGTAPDSGREGLRSRNGWRSV